MHCTVVNTIRIITSATLNQDYQLDGCRGKVCFWWVIVYTPPVLFFLFLFLKYIRKYTLRTIYKMEKLWRYGYLCVLYYVHSNKITRLFLCNLLATTLSTELVLSNSLCFAVFSRKTTYILFLTREILGTDKLSKYTPEIVY